MISVHNVPYVLKCIRNILPTHPAWADIDTEMASLLVCYPHLPHDPHLLHKQTASRSRQTGAFPGDGKILIIPNSE